MLPKKVTHGLHFGEDVHVGQYNALRVMIVGTCCAESVQYEAAATYKSYSAVSSLTEGCAAWRQSDCGSLGPRHTPRRQILHLFLPAISFHL